MLKELLNRTKKIENDIALIKSSSGRQEKNINELRFETESKFIEITKKISSMEQKIKDIEEDRRTDLSIARATRRMKFFEKMPQELQGNAFTEDIKDYY